LRETNSRYCIAYVDVKKVVSQRVLNDL
jgi:hypothetical protein